MTGVPDDGEVVLVGDFEEFIDLTRLPGIVHRNQADRIVRDLLTNCLGVDISGLPLHVGENGFGTSIRRRVRRRDERQGRSHHLIAGSESCRLTEEVECCCP
jgi:hypothetical protein